jgi:hypothetical protein
MTRVFKAIFAVVILALSFAAPVASLLLPSDRLSAC